MNKKKLLALLMALVMTLSLVPVTAFAEGNVARVEGGAEYATLQAAIDAAPDGATVTLLTDVTESVSIDKNLTVEGGNHTVTAVTNGQYAVTLAQDGVTVTLKNLNATAPNRTVNVNADVEDAFLNLISCHVTATKYYALNFRGGNNVTVDVQDSQITGWAAVNLWDTVNSKVTITNSALIGNNTYGGATNGFGVVVLEADTSKTTDGSCAHGNTITINGGTISATSSQGNDEHIVLFNAAATDTPLETDSDKADYLQNGKHAHDNTVYLNDVSVTAYNGGLVKFGVTDLNGTVTKNRDCQNNAVVISGGTYNADPTDYLADDYKAVDDGNGTWTVSAKDYVAQIGDNGQKYETLDAAVAAASAGDTVKLLQNITYGTDRVVPVWTKAVNLNLNGHTLTTNSGVGKDLSNMGYTAAAVCYSIPAASAGNVRISNGTIVTAYGAGVYADDPGLTLTLENVTINAGQTGVQSTAEYTSAVRITGGAHVIISSGSYTSAANALTVSNSGGDFTVNGGTFSGKVFSSYDNATAKIITINGGKFSGTFEKKTGTITINGGVFTDEAKTSAASVATLGEGKSWTDNSDSTYPHTVGEVKSYVAQIGDVEYTTLQEAIDAAGSSATEIVMIADTAEDAVIPEGKNITLNLNGHNIVGAQHAVTNNGTLVINDTVGTGCVYTTDLSAQGMAAVLNNETGNLTINAGWFGDKDTDKTNANDVQRGNAVRNWGTATINGGHYTACDNFTNGGYAYAIGTGGNNKGGSMTINNADVYGKMNGGIAADSGELVVNGGTFVLTSNNNYRAVWITNDGGNTSVTINDGTFVGKVAALGASIDDNKQDRSDVAISIKGGRFEALDKNAPSVKVSKSNSQYDWTTSITGGKFSTDPSAYVADGYEAVSISESPYTHQVGIVKATASTTGTIDTDSTIAYSVGTAVKESDDANAETLAERNSLTVTVSGTTEETTAANAPSVAVAALSNIKDDATLQAIVENAVEEASSSITGNNDEVNVVIQVAKSAPDTSTQGKVSFEVHPEAVISVNNVKVGTVRLENDQIKDTFTFKLNVSSIAQPGNTVKIDHIEGNTVLSSNLYTVGNDNCVVISGITSFSTFVGEKVNSQNDYFEYLGASVRRRVQTSSPEIVVNSSTDMRFGFVVKNYNSANDYYFQWKKGNGDWSSAVKITKFANTTDGRVASLVITNIPENFFETTITARIYMAGEDSALEGDAMSVMQVANAIIAKYENDAEQQQWVDYARYLKTKDGSYTVEYGNDQRIESYNYAV